jgi:hypothetical protein
MNLLNFFGFGKRAVQEVQFAVEYQAPHWIVMIRNPGQKNWVALRNPAKKIMEFNEFGEVTNSRSAVWSFANKAEADAWVSENLKGALQIHRNTSELKELLRGGSNMHMQTL